MSNELRLEVFKSVDSIGKDSIDSLSNDGYFTYEWFKTVETVQSFRLDPFYFAVRHNDKLVGFAPCFIDTGDYYFGYFSGTASRIFPFMKKILSAASWLKLCNSHVLLCYSPHCFRSRVLVEDNYDDRLILNLISKGIDSLCQKKRVLFSSFLFVSEFDRLLMFNLENLGYLKFPWLSTFYLDVQWTSFNQYLSSLPHKVRLNVRREIKKCAENGVKIDLVSDFGDLSDILATLYSNLWRRYNKSECPYNVAFYRRLNEHARDKVRLFVARKNGKVTGFTLCFEQGKTLDISHCGFDYSLQGNTDFTYFNLSYYAPIQLAIKEGKEKLYFRMASNKLKITRGCKPEKNFSFIKCYNKQIAYAANLYLSNKHLIRKP